MGKLSVALLLLLSTLSSQPLGSMEQSAPEEPLAHVIALPLARPLETAGVPHVSPDALAPPVHLPLHAAASSAVWIDPTPAPPAPRSGASLPARGSSPLDLLPYFATPPPSPVPA